MRLASLALLVAVAVPSTARAAEPTDVVIIDDEFFASRIFVGEQQESPLDGVFRLRLPPDVQPVPLSIPDALKTMERALPHWYRNALEESSGDNECAVRVNGISLNEALNAWMSINWIKRPGSRLRAAFERSGIQSIGAMRSALGVGLCYLAKDKDIVSAMEHLTTAAAFLNGGNSAIPAEHSARNYADALLRLKEQLQAGTITTIHVRVMPYNATTPVRLDGAMLRDSPTFVCTATINAAQRRQLITALERTQVRQADTDRDVHWVVDFLGNDGSALASLDMGRPMNDGVFSSTVHGRAIVGREVNTWLEGLFPHAKDFNPVAVPDDARCEFLEKF